MAAESNLRGVFPTLLFAMATVAMSLAAVSQSPDHAAQAGNVIYGDHGPNAQRQEGKHYVVLVSIDALRWDYAKKYAAKSILSIAEHGASAPQGMIPSYPSLTFPNHYTIVTGLYPEHHGIVANSFYNADRTKKYSLSDRDAVSDASWYGGTPLWVLAEQQGMRSACFFWPGSEAPIDGVRPSYYLHYDDAYPDAKRVDQVLSWLRLPAAQRPHFITLYFADVDHAGHEYGPDSPQTAAAVHKVDAQIGRLEQGIAKTHLPVDLIVLSDHGMIAEQPQWIDLDKYADLSHFKTAGSLLYADTDADAARAYDQLKIADAHFTVYRRADMPKEMHYNGNPRIGDPVIVATAPVSIRAHAPSAGAPDKPPEKGMHGFNPYQFQEMRASFYAEGPDIRRGITLEPFENVDVYPFIAEILGLEHPPVDGSANILAPALKDHPPN
jgi:predicted AlkP superfamily pyrophosphatase or phosphodiesterase